MRDIIDTKPAEGRITDRFWDTRKFSLIPEWANFRTTSSQ